MIPLVSELGRAVGIVAACEAMDIPRSPYYRYNRESGPMRETRSNRSHRSLSEDERQQVLDVFQDDACVDKAPYEIYAMLLDNGSYLCSISTMYRILRQGDEVRKRRNQLIHPHYTNPELLSTGPNEVWSWDITKLRETVKWTYYYLYVIMDIFQPICCGLDGDRS